MQLLTPGAAVADLLDPYRVDRHPPDGDRPWVMANMVAGLDGTAAVSGRVGALSEGADAELFRRMRALADVVLVGAETVRAEGYGPVRLAAELVAERTAAGRAAAPPLAVVSRSLRLDWDSDLFVGEGDETRARPIIVTCEAADTAALDRARSVATVLVAGDELVDVGRALAELRALDHQVVLCEGGPTLLGALVAGGLLDELCLTIAPVMGGDPLPVAITPIGTDLAHFDLAHIGTDDGTAFLRYEVHRGR